MSELMAVQDYAQQIAEAIATVLKMDVEIADQDLIRVAGTGIYRSSVGYSMGAQGFIYQRVLDQGREFIIDKPGYHELCRLCRYWQCCPEKFEIVYPINSGDKTVGVIGLLCFTEEDSQLLRNNQKSYLTFLGKMAETINLKIKEQQFTDSLVSSNHYLYSIINCLAEGLISVDIEGKVLHSNKAAQELLQLPEELEGTSLSSIIGSKLTDEIIQWAHKNNDVLEREVSLEDKQKRLYLVLHAYPIESETGQKNIVLTFNRLTSLSRIVHKMSMHEDSYTVDDILGSSETMSRIRDRARVVAVSNSSVLITGESGTGKEMLARAIHNLSPRRQYPFVAINCSAIPEALLESELFGYEEGSFTGARKGGKPGKFELADKGTLFLDEIGDMPLYLQVKILRALQERQIERIGSLQPVPVNVRIITATQRNLEKMMEQGEFRNDLFYRINVIPIYIKPLRERKEDLDILCRHFLRLYNQQLNKNIEGLTVEFRSRLIEYSWPGNVRELQNTIEYAMNISPGPLLDVEHLPIKIRRMEDRSKDNYNLEAREKDIILKCLKEFGSSVQGKEKAAQALGIGIATLYRKLARYEHEDNFKQ
jgi:transcriptional regulator with PAS, ATPase and Fis domain